MTWGLIFFLQWGEEEGEGRGGVRRQAIFSCTQIQLLNFIWVLCNLFSIFFHFFFQYLTTLQTTLHESDYPSIAVLVFIVLDISPGTGSVKRGYSKLGKNMLQGSSSNFIINIAKFKSLVLSRNSKLWWWTSHSSEKSLAINIQFSKVQLSLILFVFR